MGAMRERWSIFTSIERMACPFVYFLLAVCFVGLRGCAADPCKKIQVRDEKGNVKIEEERNYFIRNLHCGSKLDLEVIVGEQAVDCTRIELLFSLLDSQSIEVYSEKVPLVFQGQSTAAKLSLLNLTPDRVQYTSTEPLRMYLRSTSAFHLINIGTLFIHHALQVKSFETPEVAFWGTDFPFKLQVDECGKAVLDGKYLLHVSPAHDVHADPARDAQMLHGPVHTGTVKLDAPLPTPPKGSKCVLNVIALFKDVQTGAHVSLDTFEFQIPVESTDSASGGNAPAELTRKYIIGIIVTLVVSILLSVGMIIIAILLRNRY